MAAMTTEQAAEIIRQARATYETATASAWKALNDAEKTSEDDDVRDVALATYQKATAGALETYQSAYDQSLRAL